MSDLPDKYVCTICCDVFNSPVSIRHCGHTFCEVCLSRVVSVAGAERDKDLLCPICRQPFSTGCLSHNHRLSLEISQSSKTCSVCGTVCPLSGWDQHCALHQLPVASKSGQDQGHHRHRVQCPGVTAAPPTPNRSTFSCPLCCERNFSCRDLVAHVNSSHAKVRAQKVCPVCSSMPWGVSDQLSQDIVQHLNYRHKFEYDTFVDYNCDEDSIYQSVIAASLTDT